jgi:Uma2 family endonuclease
MAQVATAQRLTEEEYFALEEKSEIRHEFFNGEIFAMAGSTYNHSIIG